jgi:hypothetical protein
MGERNKKKIVKTWKNGRIKDSSKEKHRGGHSRDIPVKHVISTATS